MAPFFLTRPFFCPFVRLSFFFQLFLSSLFPAFLSSTQVKVGRRAQDELLDSFFCTVAPLFFVPRSYTVALFPILLLRSNRFPSFLQKLFSCFVRTFAVAFNVSANLLSTLSECRGMLCTVVWLHSLRHHRRPMQLAFPPSVYPQASCPNFLRRRSRRCKTPLFPPSAVKKVRSFPFPSYWNNIVLAATRSGKGGRRGEMRNNERRRQFCFSSGFH